jgi:hypothetical protein
MESAIVGYLGKLLDIFNFLKELADEGIFMKEEHNSEGEYLIIKFTSVDTRSWPAYLFYKFIWLDSSKTWSVRTAWCVVDDSTDFTALKEVDLTPKLINKFEEIHVKFPKTTSGIEAYNTMVNSYHNHDLVSQFKVLTYLKHLCDPNVSSFQQGNFCVSKLSTINSSQPISDEKSVMTTYTNFKMELTIS